MIVGLERTLVAYGRVVRSDPRSLLLERRAYSTDGIPSLGHMLGRFHGRRVKTSVWGLGFAPLAVSTERVLLVERGFTVPEAWGRCWGAFSKGDHAHVETEVVEGDGGLTFVGDFAPAGDGGTELVPLSGGDAVSVDEIVVAAWHELARPSASMRVALFVGGRIRPVVGSLWHVPRLGDRHALRFVPNERRWGGHGALWDFLSARGLGTATGGITMSRDLNGVEVLG